MAIGRALSDLSWSFQDSDGDGIGDLRGIEARLDYLVDLGVDAIWLSPIFPSPMADFGYDVADYCGIDPRFGTLADFGSLLASAHTRGLKVLLDFVPNHSSDQHPGLSRAARPVRIPSAIGISGATRPPMVARPIIGSATLVARHGPMTRPAANIITMPS